MELLEKVKSMDKDSAEYKALAELFAQPLTIEEVEKYLLEGEGAELLQRLTDKRVTEGIKTWKKNNLEREVMSKLKELNPDLSPEALKVKELEDRLAMIEKEKGLAELKARVVKTFAEKNLPVELLDVINYNEKIEEAIGVIEKTLGSYGERVIKERLKQFGREPQGRFDDSIPKNLIERNPYSKDYFNLTKQMDLEKNSPDVANKLKDLAKEKK